MTVLKTAAAIVFFSLPLICAAAQEQSGTSNITQPDTVQAPTVQITPTMLLPIEEIARQVQARSLEILKATRSVERARKDLVGEPELMDSSLSISGGYNAERTTGWSGASSLSLSLIPQLSAGASVSVNDELKLSESVSLSLKPLAPNRQTFTEEKALNNALVAERFLKHSIYLDAEQAALSLLIRERERELAYSREALEQKKYELEQRRREVGEASFQDVQDQLVELIDARQSMFNSEQLFLSSWKTLQLLITPGEEKIGVQPLSAEELLQWIEARKLQVQDLRDEQPSTEKLEKLMIELVALQGELQATPPWRPDLSLSTSVGFPYRFPGSHSVTLSFAISPNQFAGDEREELQEDIEIKRLEIAAETYAAQLQKTLGQQNIALVEQALISAQIQGERDRVALQEAELLFQQGQRTSLELEQLRLNLRRTEDLTFQAAIDLYRVLGEYLLLFVGE
jgi:hypothetical protein